MISHQSRVDSLVPHRGFESSKHKPSMGWLPLRQSQVLWMESGKNSKPSYCSLSLSLSFFISYVLSLRFYGALPDAWLMMQSPEELVQFRAKAKPVHRLVAEHRFAHAAASLTTVGVYGGHGWSMRRSIRCSENSCRIHLAKSFQTHPGNPRFGSHCKAAYRAGAAVLAVWTDCTLGS